jgi:hypothetical protein
MADIILGQHPLLKKEFVDRRVRDLVGTQFIADQLFTGVSVDALAIKFAVSDADHNEYGQANRDEVPQVGEASNLKRIGLTEESRSAMIKKYGLEAVITYEMQKFGLSGQVERALRKLAFNVRGMVDDMAYNVATAGYTVGGDGTQGLAKTGGFWTATGDAGADAMINDLIDARTALRKYGYTADTVVMNPEQEALLLKNKGIRDAFRQNNTDVALLRGYVGDFMGLSFITDENFREDNVLVVQKKVIGDIADAEPLRTKTYNEEQNDRTIVRSTRFTQAYLTDPKAVYLIQNVTG